MSVLEKDFQIRKVELDENKEKVVVDYFPQTKSKNVTFTDGETLQEKFDNGVLGGGAGGADEEHIANKVIHITSAERTKWNAAEFNAKEYAEQLVDSLIDAAPEAMDTLKELSDALGNDPNFATTVATEIGKKSDKGHVHTKSEITDFPTSLPANGGNADTLDGYHASDFLSTSGGTVRGALSVSGANINATNGNFYTNQYMQMEARSGYGAGVASMWYDSTNNTKILQANNIKDLSLEGNMVYHTGRKPTWDDIQGKPSTNGQYLSLANGGTVTGQTHFNTNTNAIPLLISRNGGNAEMLKLGVHDSGAVIDYSNDEYASTMEFVLKNTDTESSDGSRASTNTFKIVANNTDPHISFNNNRLYHQGYKPSPSDIGAAAASHGTHVSYGTTTSGLTAGAGGTTGSSSSVSRADHTHALPAYPTSLPANGGSATTAAKLATARTISVDGDNTGSVSFDGSANVTLTTRRRVCQCGHPGTADATNVWFKVAKVSFSGDYSDARIAFYVSSDYSNAAHGILQLNVRRGSGVAAYDKRDITWLTATSDINKDNFVLAYGNDGTNTTYELWLRTTSSHIQYRFSVLDEGGRSNTSNIWTLYNAKTGGSPAGVAAPTSGYAQVASTIAPGTHTHTSSQISDATSSSTANMIVKRDANGAATLGALHLPGTLNNKITGDNTRITATSDGYLAINNVANNKGLNLNPVAGYLKPFDGNNGQFTLGTTAARWKSVYSGEGDYTGKVTASQFVASGNSKTAIVGTGSTDVYLTNSASNKYLQLKDDGSLTYSSSRVMHSGENTMTMTQPDGKFSKPIITTYNGDTNGIGVAITGGALTIIGGGESANNVISAESISGTSEQLYLTSDNNIHFRTNCNTIANRVSATLNTSGDFTLAGKLSTGMVTGTYLAGNQGNALLNSTASAGNYTMFNRYPSTNGYFTTGGYQNKWLLQYTAKSTVDAGTNGTTKAATLLDESGNTSFPGKVSMSGGAGITGTAAVSDYVIIGDYDDSWNAVVTRRKVVGNNMQSKMGTSTAHLQLTSSSGASTVEATCITLENSSDSPWGRVNITPQSMDPWSDNVHYLGTSGRRWEAAYVTTGTVYTSSMQEKNNIVPVSGPNRLNRSVSTMDIIKQGLKDTNYYTYRYNTLGDLDENNFVGFLGQEIERRNPEFFDLIGSAWDRKKETTDGTETQDLEVVRQYDIRQASVTGVLLAGLGEALRENEELKDRVAKLEESVNALIKATMSQA